LEQREAAGSPVRSLGKDRRAVSALEYGLIVSLIAVAIVSALTTLGVNLAGPFSHIASKL
jgi:pilus assembly protein Flp/PilA